MFLKHFFHLNIISKHCFQIHSSFQHFPQPFLTQIFKTGNFYCQNASLSVSPSCSLYYISNICKKKKAQQNNTILVLSKFLLQLCTKHEAIDPWPLISMKQCILLSGSQWAAAGSSQRVRQHTWRKQQRATFYLLSASNNNWGDGTQDPGLTPRLGVRFCFFSYYLSS